jgi:type II secretion system protein N
MNNNTGKIFLYAAFFILMGIMFLFFRFPSNLAKQMIEQQLADMQSDIHLDTQSISPTFPPGIRLAPVTLSYAGLPLFNADQLSIKPRLLTMFGSEKTIVFRGAIDSGDIHGNVELAQKSNRPHTKVVFNLASVPIDALEISHQWPSYKVAGDINAYLDYDSQKGPGGTAKINLDVVPVKVIIDPPIMGLDQLEFNQLKAEITVTRRVLQIRRCEAEGPHFEGKLSGSINFRNPMADSRLTLSCTLRPQPAFIAEHKNDVLGGLLSSGNTAKRGLVFRISGTLAKPQYVIR